jgi:hypothetical protein
MGIRTPVDPDHQLARGTAGNAKGLRELAASIKSTVKPIVDSAVARLEALLATYLLKADADTYYAAKVHKHAASDITSGGTTGAGFTVGGDLAINGGVSATGDVSGARGIMPTGIRSTGARNNQVTNGYVAAYLDSDGNLGFAPSTRASKDIGTEYAVDMTRFLGMKLFNWQYKNGGMKGIGPIADDLELAGLTEFLTYGADGKLQGLRYEALTMGLWSAYVQSRTSTLAEFNKRSVQTKTVTNMTALSIGGSKSYTVVWDKPFADTNYAVVANVYTSAGVLLSGAVAASLPASRTATQCVVQVTSGVALLAGQTLIVEGIHT